MRWTLLLGLLVALLAPVGAQAAPAPEAVQVAADAALRANLRWDRPARVLVVTDAMPAEAAGFAPWDRDEVDLRGPWAWDLARPFRVGGPDAMRVLVHEDLHYPTGCHALVEEWITDAKALDEVGRTFRAVWGRPMRYAPGAGYPEGVRAIRALSALATGSPSWRSPAAWAYRDALWRAPMLPDGCALRAELLQRTAP